MCSQKIQRYRNVTFQDQARPELKMQPYKEKEKLNVLFLDNWVVSCRTLI